MNENNGVYKLHTDTYHKIIIAQNNVQLIHHIENKTQLRTVPKWSTHTQ